MRSRELVYKTLDFDGPPRAPRDLWVLPWAQVHHPKDVLSILEEFPGDFDRTPALYEQPPRIVGDPHKPGRFLDEWGCEFINLQEGVIGEVKDPLVKDWEVDGERIRAPEEWLTFDREAVARFVGGTEKFTLAGCCPRPFERLQFLRGSENFYIDLADPPSGLLAFIKRLHAFYCELLEEWAKTPVDGLTFMDDWGSQRSLLISPKTWRRLFKPLYADYAEIAHRNGKKLFMHSDGHILDVVGDLVEVGVDALNSQVFCMGPEKLEQFRGQITFWGEMDRQWLLPEGSLEDVQKAVEEFRDRLWANGGVIAQCEFGLRAKPENVREVFRTWDRLDVNRES